MPGHRSGSSIVISSPIPTSSMWDGSSRCRAPRRSMRPGRMTVRHIWQQGAAVAGRTSRPPAARLLPKELNLPVRHGRRPPPGPMTRWIPPPRNLARRPPHHWFRPRGVPVESLLAARLRRLMPGHGYRWCRMCLRRPVLRVPRKPRHRLLQRSGHHLDPPQGRVKIRLLQLRHVPWGRIPPVGCPGTAMVLGRIPSCSCEPCPG